MADPNDRNGFHVNEIVFRTKPRRDDGNPMEPVQFDWFRKAGIEGRADLQLLLLCLTACTQTLAAWAIEGTHHEDDYKYLAAHGAITILVCGELAPELWTIAENVKTGSVFKKPAFANVDELRQYLFKMQLNMAKYYQDWVQLGRNFHDAMGCATLQYLMENKHVRGTQPVSSMSEILMIATGLGDDYLAAYRRV